MSKMKKSKREQLIGAATGHGYGKEGDVYFISPGNASIMESIQDEHSALNAYIAAINLYVVPRFGELAKRRTEWWKRMKADVGSDLDGYEFRIADGSLRPIVKEAKP